MDIVTMPSFEGADIIKKNTVEQEAGGLLSELNEMFSNRARSALETYLNFTDRVPIDINDEKQIRSYTMAAVAALDELYRFCQKHADTTGGVNRFNALLSPIGHAHSSIMEAPDKSYDKEGLAGKYQGERNIPAGTATYSQTREAVQRVLFVFEGIDIAIMLS